MIDPIPSGVESGVLPESDPTFSSTDVLAFIATVAVVAGVLEASAVVASLAGGGQGLLVRFLRWRKARTAARNYIRCHLASDRLAKDHTIREPTPAQIQPLLEGWRLECERLGLLVEEVTGWKETQNKGTTPNRYSITNRRINLTRRMLRFDKNVKESPGWLEWCFLGGEDPVKIWRKSKGTSSFVGSD